MRAHRTTTTAAAKKKKFAADAEADSLLVSTVEIGGLFPFVDIVQLLLPGP